MGLFRSSNKQAAALTACFAGEKTLPQAEACRALECSLSQLPRVLRRLNRKQQMGNDAPYLDENLHLVVLDARYAAHASLICAVETLCIALGSAREAVRRASPMRGDKSRAVGSFLQRVVEAASNGEAGQVIRAESGSLVKELLAPAAPERNESAAAVLTALSEMDALAQEVLLFARAQPLAPRANEVALSAKSLRHAVDRAAKSASARRIVPPVEAATAVFRRDVKAFCAIQQAEQTEEDAVIEALTHEREQLRVRAMRLTNGRAREAVLRISDRLLDIVTPMYAMEAGTREAATRTLRRTYLPMLRELVDKLFRYEKLPATQETRATMEEGISVLENDIPKALDSLTRDLRERTDMDLAAQSEAVRRKLQLDGLLDA